MRIKKSAVNQSKFAVFKKPKIAIGTFLFSISAIAWACGVPPFQEPLFLPISGANFSATQGTISAAITAMDSAVSAALVLENQRIMSAIAVATKQKAVSASQVSAQDQSMARATAGALSALDQNERIQKATIDYGPAGQGYKPCQVSEERKSLVAQQGESQDQIPAMVSSAVFAAPGQYADPIAAQTSILQQHAALYCTADQAASGLCPQMGTRAGADLVGSTLFKSATNGSDTDIDKNALINNMIGLPDKPISQAAAVTPNGAAYSLLKQQKDALISPALAALKFIQADTSTVATDHGDQPTIPVDDQYRAQVARYLGTGQEYHDWSAKLVSSPERGVLKELLNEMALDLSIEVRTYHQLEQQEAVIASAVSIETQTGQIGALTRARAAKTKAVAVSTSGQ